MCLCARVERQGGSVCVCVCVSVSNRVCVSDVLLLWACVSVCVCVVCLTVCLLSQTGPLRGLGRRRSGPSGTFVGSRVAGMSERGLGCDSCGGSGHGTGGYDRGRRTRRRGVSGRAAPGDLRPWPGVDSCSHPPPVPDSPTKGGSPTHRRGNENGRLGRPPNRPDRGPGLSLCLKTLSWQRSSTLGLWGRTVDEGRDRWDRDR